jgi:LacI family transcriptional regulator
MLPAESLYDGYIVFSKHIGEQVMSDLLARKKPVVLIEQHASYPDASVVMIDNAEAARQAVMYLIDLGHTKITHLRGPLEAQVTHDRLLGYLNALETAGLDHTENWVIPGDFTEQTAYEAVQQLVKTDACPTAFFCASDGMAVGALLALHEAGLRVPEEVSVMGFGGYPRSAFTIPPLTTIEQPVFELGKAAAELLIELIEAEEPKNVVRCLPAPLIERGSCAPPTT